MTSSFAFQNKSVALFGLGGSGIATAKALLAGGAKVFAWDDGEASRAKASAAGIPVVDLREVNWAQFAALILTPGVPLTHPEPHWAAKKALAAGVEIIGDIELFCRERARLAPHAPLVAITGTNGKSTTTALIAHCLEHAGRKVAMGGNIGVPVLQLPAPQEGLIHVLELSSFQIDLTPSLKPSIGVMLNISPDHIDRHGTIENYAAIKERLVVASGVAIIGVEDTIAAAMAEKIGRAQIDIAHAGSATKSDKTTKLIRISGVPHPLADVYNDAGAILIGGKEVLNFAGTSTLRGAHNGQNAAAATAVLRALGLNFAEIEAGIKSYGGLPHRLEQVGHIGDVLFINDSKATNADSTEKALGSFAGNIHWIIGGKPKEGGIVPLAPYFGRIAHAYLIGEAAADFAKTLAGKVPYTISGHLEAAVQEAASRALAKFDQPREEIGRGHEEKNSENAQKSHMPEKKSQESVILLSPACASYGQYTNYEERGVHFRSIVKCLPGFES